ncbi:hypothetical protein B0H13DRAFT_1928862 [Mycena leptocephala]|nr:hypothetical protein B0H13DRAFT_1928862 [Mycena leptocephala]
MRAIAYAALKEFTEIPSYAPDIVFDDAVAKARSHHGLLSFRSASWSCDFEKTMVAGNGEGGLEDRPKPLRVIGLLKDVDSRWSAMFDDKSPPRAVFVRFWHNALSKISSHPGLRSEGGVVVVIPYHRKRSPTTANGIIVGKSRQLENCRISKNTPESISIVKPRLIERLRCDKACDMLGAVSGRSPICGELGKPLAMVELNTEKATGLNNGHCGGWRDFEFTLDKF